MHDLCNPDPELWLLEPQFAIFTDAERPRRLWSGAIEKIGLPETQFHLSDAQETVVMDEWGNR